MIRILLIRHGAVDLFGRSLYGRSPGIHINETGRGQAASAAEALKASRIVDEIVSSPLERAQETAAIIAGQTGSAITIDEGWIEVDYGDWMGRTFEEIKQLDSWQNYNRTRSTHSPPGGELLLYVQGRAFQALERILDKWSDREEATIAVVSHGDVIRGLLVLLLGMPLDHIYRLEVSPGSLSELAFDGRFPRVLRINQTFGN